MPVNRGGQIYPTLAAIPPTPTLHLARFIDKTHPSSSSSAPHTPLYLFHSYSLHSKSPPSPQAAHQNSHHSAVLVWSRVKGCTFLFVVSKCGPPQPLDWLVLMFLAVIMRILLERVVSMGSMPLLSSNHSYQLWA